ncbi:MAG: type IV pilin protein [Steroidobacteraceae bacterium]
MIRFSRKATAGEQGFTLLELMTVVAIVAILALIAIPTYTGQVRKSRRADAQQQMQQIALAQERFRSERPTYTSDWANLGGDPDIISPNGVGKYYDWPDVTISAAGVSPQTYTITANAEGSQIKDRVGSTSCSALSVNQAGGNGASAACWNK